MYTFFAFAFALCTIVIGSILHKYAAKDVPWHVRLNVFYAWLCAVIIICLVPLDMWSTLDRQSSPIIPVLWRVLYWSTQALTWLVCPIHATYMDAGNFTVGGRLLTSLKENGIFYAVLAGVGVIGILSILFFGNLNIDTLQGLGIALSNGQGLFIGIFLLGYGLVEIPRGMWKRANLQSRLRLACYRLGATDAATDAAVKELSKVIMIVQSTSAAMPRQGDKLRTYMDAIEAMAAEEPIAAADSSLLSDDDLDHDNDVGGLVSLRRRLMQALIAYRRSKHEYHMWTLEALEIEDRLNNIKAMGTHFHSTLRAPGVQRWARWPGGGALGDWMDQGERLWKCQMEPVVFRCLAAFLGAVSLAIVLAEVAIATAGKPDLSVFSLLVGKADDAKMGEFGIQLLVGWPLVYICLAAYSSLFRLGTFSFFYLVPGFSDGPSLVFSGSLMCRFAAPLSYNYIFMMPVVHRHGDHTNLAHVMGPMDSVPFFGGDFLKYFPTVIVGYCLAIIFNVHNRLMACFSKTHRFQFDEDTEDDACTLKGKAIMRDERTAQESDAPVGVYKPKARVAPSGIRALFATRRETPAPAKAKEPSAYSKLREGGYRPGAYSTAKEAAKAPAKDSLWPTKAASSLLGLGGGAGSSAGAGGSGSNGRGGGGAMGGLDGIFSTLKGKSSDVEDDEEKLMATELLPRGRKR